MLLVAKERCCMFCVGFAHADEKSEDADVPLLGLPPLLERERPLAHSVVLVNRSTCEKVVVHGIDVLEGDFGSGGGMEPGTQPAVENASSIRATELRQMCSVPVHVNLPMHVLKLHLLVERHQKFLLLQKSCVGGAVSKPRKISLLLE